MTRDEGITCVLCCSQCSPELCRVAQALSTLMSTQVFLFVPFYCGYEQIIQFCSGIDMCTYRDGKGQKCDRMGTERGKGVNWEKSRSMIQLCARKKGDEGERNTGKLREGRKKNTEMLRTLVRR